MNESILNQESKKSTSEPKLFGMPRFLAGALIGILIYALLVLLSVVGKLNLLATIILFPGFWVTFFDNRIVDTVIFFVVPSIPFAVFGALIASKQETKRAIGFVASIIYFLLLVLVGLPLAAIAGDW